MSAKVLTKAAAKEAKIDLIEGGRGTQAVHDTVVAMRAARRSGSRCVLLRHRDYPLLRAFFALCPDLLLWTDPPTFGLEAFSLLRELRAFCDLCVESFFFSAGVSIENPFSASGA